MHLYMYLKLISAATFSKKVFFVSEDTFAKNVLPLISDTPKKY